MGPPPHQPHATTRGDQHPVTPDRGANAGVDTARLVRQFGVWGVLAATPDGEA